MSRPTPTPHPRVTRRAVMVGLAAGLATPAVPQIRVEASPRPRPRPSGLGRDDIAAALERRVAEARLGGQVSYAVVDARSGTPIAARTPDMPLPPASTAKALTAAYALDHVGPAHRFETTLRSTGPLRQGRIEGDLILAGGGDPMLDSAGLALLLNQLGALGVRAVTGRFRVWGGALPGIAEVEPDQPDHLAYNPAVAGLNLNYNRVHFQWRRQGEGYAMTVDARAGNLVPPVRRVRMRAADRDSPVYVLSRDPDTGIETWSVSRPALGQGGTRWLPVRDPPAYAGEVLRTLAATRDPPLDLPPPEVVEGPLPASVPLAAVQGPPVAEVVRGMLRYSTNLTAEVLGLAASTSALGAAPAGLAASAAAMNGWGRAELGMAAPALLDHSGLNAGSRVTATDMVRALVTLGPDGPLLPLLPEIGLRTPSGATEPFELRAKTGTLNFVSCLAGYVRAPRRGPVAFAILTGELARRAAIPPGGEESPPGSAGWTRRSREMQYDLVRIMARAG